MTRPTPEQIKEARSRLEYWPHPSRARMTCLLCPSPAVADCLCVPCGAKFWAAKEWEERPDAAAQLVAAEEPPKDQLARWLAIVLMRSEWQRVAFRSDLEAARAERAAKEARDAREREGER